MLKDVFGFAEHQERATHGLGHKLTLTGEENDAVLNKTGEFAVARFKIDNIYCYYPHYTPSIPQQGSLTKAFLSRTHTELRYIGITAPIKEEINQNLWDFEIGSQESINSPIRSNVQFQQRARQDSQNLNNDTFVGFQLEVLNAY